MKILKKIYSKIRHWCCKVGLCNLDTCGCECHDEANATQTIVDSTDSLMAKQPDQEENLNKMLKAREAAPIKKNHGNSRLNMINRQS